MPNETQIIDLADVKPGELLDIDGGWREVVSVEVADGGIVVRYLRGKAKRRAEFPPGSTARVIDELVPTDPDKVTTAHKLPPPDKFPPLADE